MMGGPPLPPDEFSMGIPFYMSATLFFFVNIVIWLVIGYVTGTAMWFVLLIMLVFLAVGGGVMWFFVRMAEKEKGEDEEKEREWWE